MRSKYNNTSVELSSVSRVKYDVKRGPWKSYGNSPVDLVIVQYYVFHYFQVRLYSQAAKKMSITGELSPDVFCKILPALSFHVSKIFVLYEQLHYFLCHRLISRMKIKFRDIQIDIHLCCVLYT